MVLIYGLKDKAKQFAAWLAQLVERQPFKLVAVGSSPTSGKQRFSFALFWLQGRCCSKSFVRWHHSLPIAITHHTACLPAVRCHGAFVQLFFAPCALVVGRRCVGSVVRLFCGALLLNCTHVRQKIESIAYPYCASRTTLSCVCVLRCCSCWVVVVALLSSLSLSLSLVVAAVVVVVVTADLLTRCSVIIRSRQCMLLRLGWIPHGSAQTCGPRTICIHVAATHAAQSAPCPPLSRNRTIPEKILGTLCGQTAC